MKRHETRWMVVLLTAVAWTAAPAQAVGLEAMRLSEPVSSSSIPAEVVRDFGMIAEGTPIVLDLEVHNQGSSELRIGAVRPLCACMSQESVTSVAAGETGKISLRLETVGYAGPTTEAALIEWLDSAVPVTRVEMKLEVEPVLELLPRRMVRFRVQQGEAASQKLEIQRTDGSAFEISRVESSASFIAVARSGKGAKYELAVELAADAPAGVLRETITVHTSIPSIPQLEVKVTGVVIAPKKG